MNNPENLRLDEWRGKAIAVSDELRAIQNALDGQPYGMSATARIAAQMRDDLSAAQKRIEIQAQEIERLNLTIRHYDHLSSASQDYKDYKLCPICRTDPCCGEAGCP